MNETYVTIRGRLTADPSRATTRTGAPMTSSAWPPRRAVRCRASRAVGGRRDELLRRAVATARSPPTSPCRSRSGQPVTVHGKQRVESWQRDDGDHLVRRRDRGGCRGPRPHLRHHRVRAGRQGRPAEPHGPTGDGPPGDGLPGDPERDPTSSSRARVEGWARSTSPRCAHRRRPGSGRCRGPDGWSATVARWSGRRRRPPPEQHLDPVPEPTAGRARAGDRSRGCGFGPGRVLAVSLAPMPEFIYVMSKARKAHGDKVILDDVTMSFYPGAKIGVVGPNGAGKSSVLKIMAGLDQPSNGEARLTPGLLGRHPHAGARAQRGEDRPRQRRGGRRRDQGQARPLQRDLRRDGRPRRRLRRADGPRWASSRRPSTPPTRGTSTPSSSRPWTPCAARRRTPTSRCSPAVSAAASPCASCCCRSPTCCCSTSPPTTSTPSRCCGSSSTSRPTTAPSSR